MTYGNDPDTEVWLAVRSMCEIGADGYVFDAEKYIENKHVAGRIICQGVREHIEACAHCDGKKLAYAPFRNPLGHRTLPYEQFGRYCDAVMPQVYWWYPMYKNGKKSPKRVFLETYHQWLRLEAKWRREGNADCVKPMIPLGQTMYGAPPPDIKKFFEATKGYHGVCFWKWEDTTPSQWQAIKDGR